MSIILALWIKHLGAIINRHMKSACEKPMYCGSQRGILLCSDGSGSLLCFEFLGAVVGLLGLSSSFRELLLGELLPFLRFSFSSALENQNAINLMADESKQDDERGNKQCPAAADEYRWRSSKLNRSRKPFRLNKGAIAGAVVRS
jgi:hypothetical protein